MLNPRVGVLGNLVAFQLSIYNLNDLYGISALFWALINNYLYWV